MVRSCWISILDLDAVPLRDFRPHVIFSRQCSTFATHIVAWEGCGTYQDCLGSEKSMGMIVNSMGFHGTWWKFHGIQCDLYHGFLMAFHAISQGLHGIVLFFFDLMVLKKLDWIGLWWDVMGISWNRMMIIWELIWVYGLNNWILWDLITSGWACRWVNSEENMRLPATRFAVLVLVQ